MPGDPFVELRGEIPAEYMEIIDAVVQATPGSNRMKVVREILGNWVDQKAHEATLIQNVRGANGSRPEARRNAGGRAAQ